MHISNFESKNNLTNNTKANIYGRLSMFQELFYHLILMYVCNTTTIIITPIYK